MKIILLVLCLICTLLFIQCQKESVPEEILNPTPNNGNNPEENASPDLGEILLAFFDIDISDLDNYSSPILPDYYNAGVRRMDNTPADNQVTNLGATLGRILFYDTNLSLNNTISCASCHAHQYSFTDGEKLSSGFNGDFTGAHSMRLLNVKYYEGQSMFWDKRASTLEEQTTQPIKDPTEMGYDESAGGINTLIQKMASLDYYPPLFEEVFGPGEISEEKIQLSLSQFIRSMISSNSKFDEGYDQVYNDTAPDNGINSIFPNFTASENRGKNLYFSPLDQGGLGCQGCHKSPTFTLDEDSGSNGLDPGETLIFKSPSLKNIAISGPYMHDGRFNTLREVIEHYDNGIQNGPALDNRLRRGSRPVRLNLSEQDKNDLIAFLNTLTDFEIIRDEKFSNPFSN